MAGLDLDAVYREYAPFVLGYMRRRGQSREAAEDLASQVWIKITRNQDQYEDRGVPISAWIASICRSILIDNLRQEGRVTFVRGDAGDALMEDVALAPDEIAEFHAETNFEHLLALLDDRPLQQRVIDLRFRQRLSSIETAQMLGNTVDAVKKIQARAVATLRRRINGQRRPGGSMQSEAQAPSQTAAPTTSTPIILPNTPETHLWIDQTRAYHRALQQRNTAQKRTYLEARDAYQQTVRASDAFGQLLTMFSVDHRAPTAPDQPERPGRVRQPRQQPEGAWHHYYKQCVTCKGTNAPHARWGRCQTCLPAYLEERKERVAS